jgi:hypothetical protein
MPTPTSPTGYSPTKALRAFFPTDERTPARLRGLADRLVEAGLWEETGADSWQIHDYAVYQAEAMSERVERKREWDRNRQAVNRSAKNGKPNSRVINDLRHLSQRDIGGQLVDSRVDSVRGRMVDVSTPVTVVSRGTDPIRSRNL